MSEYLNAITDCLARIESEEAAAMAEVSERVAETIISGGIIFVFGCGHSHLPGLDTFYRAGGLANVSPMLDTDLMLHNGAAKSSRMEKMQGIGAEIYRRYSPGAGDMLFVVSASGKNSVPLEVAESGVKHGLYTVGISSSEYFAKGGRLQNVVTKHIDSKVPYGDACIPVGDAFMGGLSTAASCFILNSVLINGARIAVKLGARVPIYLSGNVEGGREHNIALEEEYFGRVKHL